MAQKRRKSSSSSGGIFSKLLWAFVIASLALSWFKTPVVGNPEGIVEWGAAKSQAVEVWVESWSKGGFIFNPSIDGKPSDWFGKDGNDKGGTGGTDPKNPPASGSSTIDKNKSLTELEKIKVAPDEKVNYDRGEWKHWSTVSTCWDTREAVLVRDAVKGSTKYQDKNKQPASSLDNACTLTQGEWLDPYTGKVFTDPKKLDIDHMIPLSYAAKHGGQAWDAKKKEQYANSMNAGHLLAVSASENRTKGDKGPSSWKPTDKGNWCQYAGDWISVSNTWGLSTTENDKAALKTMLATCK